MTIEILCYKPNHTAHADMMAFASQNVRYSAYRECIREGVPAPSSSARALLTKAKSWVEGSTHASLYVRMLRRSNVSPEIAQGYDLVHVCGSWTTVSKSVPWTADVEHASALFRYAPAKMQSIVWRAYVRYLLGRDNCRGLLMWSDAAKQSVAAALQSRTIDDKTFVVHPTCGPLREPNGSGEGLRPTILFVGRNFWGKGGALLLQAVRMLRSRSFRVVVVSGASASTLDRFADLHNVEFVFSDFTRAKLIGELFGRASIFCMPSMSDTYGYVFAEAMACGLPVVAARTRGAAPELIKPGKTGFLIEPPTEIFDEHGGYRCTSQELETELQQMDCSAAVGELAAILDELLSNGPLRRSLSQAAYAQFINGGWLSLDTRAEQLEHAYARMIGS